MYFLGYKTTNIITNSIYIGIHRTNIKNDGYIGSGILLGKSIEKYGRENFTREILIECNNIDELFAWEAAVVDAAFIRRKDTYNIQLGGSGGAKDATQTNYYLSGNHLANIDKARFASYANSANRKAKRIADYNINPKTCKCCGISLSYEKRINKFCSSSCAASINNLGRVLTEDTKSKISKKLVSKKRLELLEKRRQNVLTQNNLIQHRISIILKIDPTYVGWVTEVANSTGIQVSRVKKFIHKHMLGVYSKYYPNP